MRPGFLAPRRLRAVLSSPGPYLGLVGCALVLAGWYLTVDQLALPRFAALPALGEVASELTSSDPVYGTSVFTHAYYVDIWISVRRVLEAFALAVALGVPLGLAIGWSRQFRELTFPVFELIRPIPILAWVPLAILMFPRGEQPVIFLTFLSAFFVMTLNTLLGVQSVDADLVRAARCLGASPRDVLRTVIVPGALPYVMTGMKVAIGVSWFSLVAGEMVAGQSGLGYLINSSYATVRYPTIVIGMLTLGLAGFATSTLVGLLGERLVPSRGGTATA